MTVPVRQRIIVVVLCVVWGLAGCGQYPQLTPTAPSVESTPTATPQPVPTTTRTPTSAPTIAPSPTPTQGLATSLDALAAAFDLTFAQTQQVGALARLEAEAPGSGLQVNAIVYDGQLLSVESTLTADDEAILVLFDALAALALPNWGERTAWLQTSLAAAEPGGLPIVGQATAEVYASLLRYDDADNTVALLLSLLCCDNAAARGELQPFDPTLSTGLTRQALQWAYEGLPSGRRFTFSRAGDRMGQPVVIGTASDKRATLTLVGPEEQLVFINLSLAVPNGVADAEAQAIALTQRLLAVVLPNWEDGPSWAETAVRGPLAGQTHEQRRQGLRLLARPDPANERLVDITIAAIQRELSAQAEAALTQTPALTVVTVSGLPAEALACLSAVFYRDGVEVERVPLSDTGIVSGPEADEVLLDGDPSGTCPWADYWTTSSQLPVTEGQVEFSFAPVPK